MVEKRAYTQADFSLGVTIPELIDGDDTEVRATSLQDGKNLRVTRGRTLRARPGLELKVSVAEDQDVYEMRVQTPQGERKFAIVVQINGLQIYDDEFGFVAFWDAAPWGVFASGRPWAAQFENTMIFGGYEFYALQYKDGEWSFGPVTFAQKPGGEWSIPYWSYERGTAINPSGYTGSVTVTASASIFSAAWVGKRIRYSGREMVVTAVASGTSLTATVTAELPPTFVITFASSSDLSGYAVGDIVTASETSWSGIVASKGSTTLTCVTVSDTRATSAYGGPITDDEIVGPNAAKKPDSISRASSPASTTVWDEQVWSNHRGWPKSGAEVNGRLALCNFPEVPNLIAISSARWHLDFEIGAADDDAILRTAGNRNPRFQHIVNGTDLLLLADRGCYYVKTRDGELLTPSNFQVTQFDERGTDEVAPVVVEGGVLFVEKNKRSVAACVLSGNVYLNWRVIDLTRFHAHLIRRPIAICGPTSDTEMSERYVMIVNEDGTLAVMSWFTDFGEDRVGFIPWETQGRKFRNVFPLFGKYAAIVQNKTTFTLEIFNPDYYLDGATPVDGLLNGTVLATDGLVPITTDGGEEIRGWQARFAHLADRNVKAWRAYETILSDTLDGIGEFQTAFSVTADQLGVPIDVRAKPWPREVLESPRRGMIKARVIRAAVAVRDTVGFAFRRNATTTVIPPRRPSDPEMEPPPLKTDWYRFNVFGNRAHPEMEIFLQEPNPFEITSITQEVQA